MTDKKPTSLSSSFRYPSSSLEACLSKTKILFEKNSTNICSSEAIVLDLGFSGKNGSSKSLLASMKYYGLLETINVDKLKVADFIINYCISGELNTDILSKSLNSVPINKKIFGTYDFANLPSENEIKSFLIKTCDYNFKQAGNYIDIFNKNITLFYEHKKLQSSFENLHKQQAKEMLSPAHESANRLGLDLTEMLDDKVKSISELLKKTTIAYPLISNQHISIHLPADIKEIELEDLEDIKDILELVLKKVNNQIKRREV